MYDDTQESASRYAEDQTPKAPKVSPDEALVQHLSYVTSLPITSAGRSFGLREERIDNTHLRQCVVLCDYIDNVQDHVIQRKRIVTQ